MSAAPGFDMRDAGIAHDPSVGVVAAIRAYVGIGLKTPHVARVLAEGAALEFFEVHAENYMVGGGPFLRHLQRVR
ncbi:MAG: multinuclear nonheme iron-dependent oxidase, partial [Rubrivivax sp.]